MFRKIRLIGHIALCLAAFWLAQAHAAQYDRPSGLTAVSQGNTIVLNWTIAINSAVTEQRVHRVEQGSRERWNRNFATLPAGATTFTDTTVEPGKKYKYAVEALRPGTERQPLRYRRTEPTRPLGIGHSPPHNLAASVVVGEAVNEVVLSWTPGTNPDYVRQYVQRRQAKGEWANVAELAADTTTWTDQNVVLGEKYLYVIRGEKANGKGGRSQRITVKVAPPNSPHDLTVGIVESMVVLAWIPGGNPNHVRQVVLRRQERGETWNRVMEFATDTATWIDTNTMSGEQYFYRIRAEKANGKGGMTKRVGIVAP